MSGGQKIIDGLREAVAGNLAVVTIDGVMWVRKDVSRVGELESALARALKAANAGAGSRQWEKIEDVRAILREALGT